VFLVNQVEIQMTSGTNPGAGNRPGNRSRRGQSFIEAVCAAFIIIPIALCLLDLIVLVVANSMNDTAAKNAARAAANQPDGPSALAAAQKSLNSFHGSAIVNSIIIADLSYPDPNNSGAVSCVTQMQVHMPMPFPGFADITFKAEDVEPIVGAKVKP
jgi:hypothetical protein